MRMEKSMFQKSFNFFSSIVVKNLQHAPCIISQEPMNMMYATEYNESGAFLFN